MALRTVIAPAVLVLALMSSRAEACSCADRGAQELLRGAHVVFSGEVVRSEILDAAGNPVLRKGRTAVAPAEVVTFRVHEIWKGDVGEAIRVWNLVGPPGNCGVELRIGEKYLVFAQGDTTDPRWAARTMLCFGTGHVREAATRRHLSQLGKPTRVTGVPPWWGDLLDFE
jgi:hypothetical protein